MFFTHACIFLAIIAIDLFERSSLEDERIRTNHERYFKERWRNYNEDSSHIRNTEECDIPSPEDKNSIRNTLCSTLPKALNLLLRREELFLFNEHYVVKPPQSRISFRWHRDADEQLQFCHDQNIEYYSLWCPLDDVNERNGTLQLPHGTNIHTIDISELSHSSQSQSGNEAKLLELISSPITSSIEHQSDPLCPSPSSDAPPVSITVPRGSGVVFSSLMWHCSGANASDAPRRVLYVQYSKDIITSTGRARAATTTTIARKRKWQEEHHTPSRSPNTTTTLPLPLCFAIPCECTGRGTLAGSTDH